MARRPVVRCLYGTGVVSMLFVLLLTMGAAMNHIYRLCWNRSRRQWAVASELASRRPGRSAGVIGKDVRRVAAIAFAGGFFLATGPAYAGGEPTGGQIVSGVGTIRQLGATTTIEQGSQTLRLNWQSFNVGAGQTVNFVQPGSSAVAVNRILGSTPSTIFGHLNANGQVWLINPNGVLFGPSARVNVGGIVASTLDVDSGNPGSDTRRFSGNGKGSVVNQGTITAAGGGYVALLGNKVSNQGVITARLGTIALAGGSAATLTFAGSQLVHIQVDASTLGNLAENRQLLVADGGQVIMTAGAKDALLASAVNNTGMVRAQTVEDHEGKIVLLGGMEAGQVNVGGTLDASAPNGGNGGSIETSAAQFNLAPDTHITAAAPFGRAGTWLVDPTDLTIDANAASQISSTLQGGTNVVEQTTASGATGFGMQTVGAGDINVNSAISWTNASASLTLDALNAIYVNAPVTGAGAVTMQAGTGNLTIASGATITGGAGVVLATNANFVNNAGSSAVSTGTSAPWLIYSTDPRLDTDGGLTPSYIQYNAPYGTTAAAAGNGFLYSLAPTITLTGLTGNVTKVYDGTTTAALTGANLQTTGLVNGDAVASATGTYATSNAGTDIAVNSPTSFAGVVINTSTGIPAYGYQAKGTASADIGTITPAPLTATIVNNPTKVYDGTTSAPLTASNYSFTGFVAGQGASVNQASSVSYASADAGTAIPVNATLTSTNFVASSGTNLANYTLPSSAAGAGTITPAPLRISGLIANDKVYDGTRTDTLNLSDASLFGVISSDSGQVSLDTGGATGTFVSPNVGNNILVVASGFTLTGAKASDYQITPSLNLAADITPKSLTITGVTANDKVYDATTTATLNLGNATISGLVPSDAGNVSLSTSGATGAFSQSNVGNNLPVSVNGLALAGSAAGNYSVTGITGLAANITPAPLTITFLGSPTKVYDGSANATPTQSNYTISGFVGGQSATIGQASGSYATPNAGTGITITAALTSSDFVPAAGTSMSNYTFASSVTSPTGIITPAPVEVDIINNPTKVYDGTNTASLGAGNYQLSGAIPGESITLNPYPATGSYATPNVGYQGVSTTLTTGNFQAGTNTLLSNYDLPTTATGMGTIVQRPISGEVTASITDNPSKTYDGTTVATIPASDFTFSGFVGTDSATVSHTITGQYATKNAGLQAVTASLAESDVTAGAGTNLNNYSFPIAAYGTGTILPAQLTVTIIGNPTKVYNGDTIARLSGSNFQIRGFVSGEGASITPSAQFNYDQANAGSRTVSGSLVPGNYTASSGTLLSNYLLPVSATGPGTITPAPLYILNTYATSKVYDTTTADTLNVSSAALSGVVPSDAGNVTLNTSSTGTFAQANVGNNIAVTPSGFSISGSAAGNYTLQPLTGLTANITPAQLTVNGALANNKVYDGTTTATINNGNATLSGVLGNDSVNLSSGSATGQFITANAGTNLQVTASGFTLSGPQAGNYSVTQPSNLFANITPAPLAVTITGNPVKQYDGTTSVALGASDFTITGFVGNQSATVTQTASSGYFSPNVGTNIGIGATLEPSDYRAALGTNLSNYNLPTQVAGTLGEITAKIINLTGTRVYDGTVNADSPLFSSAGVVYGINGETLTLSGTGTLPSKNVGKRVPLLSLGSLALANGTGLASNYTLAGGNDWVTITPAMLTVLNTIALNKVYDGTTAATLQNALLSGVVGSDDVLLGNDTTGNFNNKNVGTSKPVSTIMTISGTDAGNYTLVQPTGIKADITALGITATATGIDKQYDGTTAAQVNMSSGVVPGDSVGYDYTASFSQANVGNNLPVTVTGITLSGADAGNYTLLNTATSTIASITPRVLSLQGTRVYDAATDANANLFAPGGSINGVNGETLTLNGTGTVTTKNVGSQVPFANLGTLALGDGTGGGLSSNYTLTGGTDWVTITPATLTVSGTVAHDKQYDGNTNAQLTSATLEGVLSSDNVTLGDDTVGQFNDKNVGTGKPVTTSMTVSGTDAGNYVLVQPAGLTASITALPIITVDATGNNKIYDGTRTATVGLTSPNVVAGDNVTFSDTSATFATPNVGNNIPVAVLGIGIGGADAGNYVLENMSATTSANITPFLLNLQGTRVYDSTTNASAGLFGSNGVLTGANGETLTLSGTGTLASKNVNSAQPFAANGLTGFTLTGNNGALPGNYTLADGNDWVNITPATLTVIGTTVNTKVYDATTNATLSGATFSGLYAGDDVTLDNGTVGTFNDKNVGTGKSVTTNMSISGTDAANYTFTGPTGLTGSITALGITVNATSQDKTYDGTTTATATVGSTGVLAGDTVNFGFSPGNANFATPNAGNGITVTVNGITASGTDVGNYTYNTTATTSANILPVVLNLTGTRTYDGTTGAVAGLFGTSGVLTGVNGETLTLSGTGTLSTKNAGSQVSFAASGLDGFTLMGNNGALSSNYTFAGGTDWVTINPLAITVNTTAQSRYYNGTTAASATITPTGVLAGDTVNFGFANANFATPNAGNGITVTVNGIAASGTDAGNYTYNTTATTTADISPYVLSLQGTRVYDGTTSAGASLFGSNGTLTGVNGETLTLSGTGTLAGKNVSAQQPFAADGLTGFALTGNNGSLSGNYTLGNGVGDWVGITPKAITITAAGENKVYDGTTTAQLSSFTVNGLVVGDSASVGYNSANFATANVGTNIPITVGLYGNGTDIGNYTFGSTVVTTSADITQRALTITTSAQNKTYDATTTATLNGLTVSGLVGSDTASFTAGSANFVTPNAGNNIQVNVAGISGTGRDLGNYTYNTTATTNADILPAVLNLTGSRVYDGTNQADASLFGNAGQLTGVAGQTLTLSGTGTLTGRNAGQQQPFTANGLAGYALTGNGSALTSNYTLAGGVDWVTITPLAVTVTATGASKVYDSSRTASVGLASSGILSGDSVSFSAQSANFVTPNAGNGIPILVTGIAGSGADAGNYTFNTVATTSANITPVVLSLSGSRVYDATTGAAASLFGTNGVLQGVNGETLTLSGTGTLSTKNVGTQVAFAPGGLGGYTLTGNGAALAGNYTLPGGVDWVAITPAILTVAGTQTTNRTYNGTVLDALSRATLSGVLGVDNVTLGNDTVGYFNDPNVGFNKPVRTEMSIGGSDSGNYVLEQPGGLTADIVTPIAPVPAGTLASVQAPLGPDGVATPYGTAPDTAQGNYAGNQMQEEVLNQRNVARPDFHPGLALTVLNGGVRLPAN